MKNKTNNKTYMLSDYGKEILKNLNIDIQESKKILSEFKSGKLKEKLQDL